MTAQKIKKDLIDKAKVRKAYAKIKAQEQTSTPGRPSYYDLDEDHRNNTPGGDETVPGAEPATLELHPDRQAMLDAPPPPEPQSRSRNGHSQGERDSRRRRPKPSAFAKEAEIAEKRKQAQEARQKERELKAQERDAMARARRPDQFGKQRLGRQSTVLLSKIQRMVGST
jgi:hypothetical protein